jgi:hypothetical protein
MPAQKEWIFPMNRWPLRTVNEKNAHFEWESRIALTGNANVEGFRESPTGDHPFSCELFKRVSPPAQEARQDEGRLSPFSMAMAIRKQQRTAQSKTLTRGPSPGCTPSVGGRGLPKKKRAAQIPGRSWQRLVLFGFRLN